jgi:hypothetical protein
VSEPKQRGRRGDQPTQIGLRHGEGRPNLILQEDEDEWVEERRTAQRPDGAKDAVVDVARIIAGVGALSTSMHHKLLHALAALDEE